MSDGSAGLTFAVPDLHGRYDLLEDALEAMAARAGGPANVIFLGDYIDRGPQSADILDRLMAGPPQGWAWTCLKGNHEAMMGIGLREPERLDWWIGNGGDATIRSYDGDRARVARHLAFIESLPLMTFDAHRVYVHAGVAPGIPLERQEEKILLWKRYPAATDEGHGSRHVVHGHDPNTDGPLCHSRRTDLDTLAWRTGRLVIGVFADDRPGGPADFIELRRRPVG